MGIMIKQLIVEKEYVGSKTLYSYNHSLTNHISKHLGNYMKGKYVWAT